MKYPTLFVLTRAFHEFMKLKYVFLLFFLLLFCSCSCLVAVLVLANNIYLLSSRSYCVYILYSILYNSNMHVLCNYKRPAVLLYKNDRRRNIILIVIDFWPRYAIYRIPHIANKLHFHSFVNCSIGSNEAKNLNVTYSKKKKKLFSNIIAECHKN